MTTEKKVRRIGITGGIAMGKSTVTNYLRSLGYRVLDADQTYRDLISSPSALTQTLISAFGEDIAADDGSIDRAKLGELVFSNDQVRHRLDQLTHPVIFEAMAEAAEAWEKTRDASKEQDQLLFFDVPLLFESEEAVKRLGLEHTWMVYTDPRVQKQRLQSRDGWTGHAAEQRIQAQMSAEEKVARADVIITNNSTLDALERGVQEALQGELHAGD